MKRVRRILYATDFSRASGRAFDTAIGMAKSLGARLTIVNAIAPLVIVPPQFLDPVTMDRLYAEVHKWSTQQLGRAAARAKHAGVKTAIVLRDGDAAEEIIRTCRATKSDLIVVGTHGRHGLPKFFLGSVAERVVSRAPCPVVTVRGQSS